MTTLTIDPRSLTGKAMSRGKSPKTPSQLVIPLDFAAAAIYTLSLQISAHFRNVQGIEGIQSVYIDNSANPSPLLILFDTGQLISCPAASQATYPVFFPGESLNCQFSSIGGVKCSVIFLNTREQTMIWGASSGGGGGSVTQGTVPWVVSGTVTATPTGTYTVAGTVTANQGTSPWVVSGTITCNQGSPPWEVNALAGDFAAGWSPDVGNVGSVTAWHNSGGGVPNALNILSGIEANTAAPVGNIGVGPSNLNALGNSATASASLLLAARTGAPGTGRVQVSLLNTSAVPCYIGPTNAVTAAYTGGWLLPANMTQPFVTKYTGNIYAITASSTATIAIFEEY